MKKTHLLLMLALCATLLASCSAGEPDVTQTQPVPSISPTNTPDENTVLPGLDDDIILPDGGRNDSTTREATGVTSMDKARRVIEQLEEELERLSEVKEAHVIIAGHKAAVALTFDDGHHAELTPQVLDVLKRYDAQACFFLVGERIDPGLLRRMDAEGHIVGNHTFSHKGTGPFAPVRSMVTDARRTDDAIAGTLHRRPKLFRPPFGVTNPMIGGMVRRMGYTVIGWSIRSLDTLAGPRSKVVERIRRQLHDGAIILLHDNRTGSPQLAELVLRMLAQEGYEVVRVDKLLNIHAYDNEN